MSEHTEIHEESNESGREWDPRDKMNHFYTFQWRKTCSQTAIKKKAEQRKSRSTDGFQKVIFIFTSKSNRWKWSRRFTWGEHSIADRRIPTFIHWKRTTRKNKEYFSSIRSSRDDILSRQLNIFTWFTQERMHKLSDEWHMRHHSVVLSKFILLDCQFECVNMFFHCSIQTAGIFDFAVTCYYWGVFVCRHVQVHRHRYFTDRKQNFISM